MFVDWWMMCYNDLNAADTNAFLANLIKGRMTTGLVMMDFAGVDRSGSYDVMGRKLVNAVIRSNF